MFDDIYDNGYLLLGKVKNVKEYACKNADYPEEIKEIIEELENYDADDIVAINYGHPMGYTIDVWKYDDKVEV